MGLSLISCSFEVQYGRFTRWNLIITREMIFFILSKSKDYASWFQTKKMTISLNFDIMKRKLSNIPFVNVSNQLGSVMKLKLKKYYYYYFFFF